MVELEIQLAGVYGVVVLESHEATGACGDHDTRIPLLELPQIVLHESVLLIGHDIGLPRANQRGATAPLVRAENIIFNARSVKYSGRVLRDLLLPVARGAT